jgi:NADPH-dependent glutamate synthase beta subunit-like oxidoreductase
MFDVRASLGGGAAAAIPDRRLKQADLAAEIEAVFADFLGDHLTFREDEGLTADRTLDDFDEEYDAVFLAMGLGGSPSLEESRPAGVEDAVAFLERCKRGEAAVPERVAVLGGGNTAMDAAVQAALSGAKDVYLVYRRSLSEMPAWPGERDEAMGLGVHFLLLTQPLGYVTDDKGRVHGVRIARTVLGEPDASGRRKPVPVQGSESVLEADLVLEALGQKLPSEMESLIPGVALTGDRLIKIDEHGRTSRSGVYAGGDIVNGGTTVVRAIADGMRAAEAIDAYLEHGEGKPTG